MIKFKSVEVENLVTYKKAKLQLDKYPIIVVRGRNNDRRAKNSANAVGKSLLLSTIPAVRYGMPPTMTTKRSAKVLHGKGSKITLNVHNHNKAYKLTQFQRGKTLAYDVVEEGKALNYRKSDDAFNKISNVIPILEQQFYSFCYVDARRSHPLHIGSAAQRFAFFEQAFGLDVYDSVGKIINKEYNGLKYQSQQLLELESEFQLKKKGLSKSKLAELKIKQTEMVKKIETIRNKVNNKLEHLRNTSNYITLAKGVDTSLNVADIAAEIKELTADDAAMTEDYKASIKHHAQIEKYEQFAKRKQRLEEKIEKLENSVKDIDISDLDITKTRILKIRDKIKQEASVADERAELKQRLELLPLSIKDNLDKYPNTEKVRSKIDRAKQKIETYSDSIKTLSVSDEGFHCVTCFQKLTGKQRRAIIENCTTGIEQNKKLIEKLKKVHEFLTVREKLNSLPDVVYTRTVKEKYMKLREKYKVMKKAKTQLDELRLLKKELHSIQKYTRPEGKVTKPAVYEGMLEKLREHIEDLRSTHKQLIRINQLDSKFSSYDEAELEFNKLQLFVEKYQPVLQKMQDILQRITIDHTQSSTLYNELTQLKKRIDKQKHVASEYKVYEALRQAYGAKGLRKARSNIIAAQLEQNLNKFAPLLFAEPITFTIDVTNTKFDILAERNNKPAADVKTLSGSEGRCFVLLLIIAQLPFIPANVRSNLIVLDEMESLLDVPSRKLFTDEFLPVLNTIIPNIVIITSHTKSEFDVTGAVTYSVEKTNGQSSLILEGQPHA